MGTQHWLLIGALAINSSACASLPIQQRESERLTALPTGASVDEFRVLFPDAYIGGQRGTVAVWMIHHSGYADFRPGPLNE
jgi:hypothetical protein